MYLAWETELHKWKSFSANNS